LSQFGSEKAAAYLRAGITIDADVCGEGIDGIEVRWTRILAERAMGEVANGASETDAVEAGMD